MADMMTKNSTLENRGAIFTVVWGLWLFLGNSTSLDATAFAYLREVWTWGDIEARYTLSVTAMLVGVSYMASIKINGAAMAWTPIVRLMCAGFNVAFFATIAYSISRVDFFSPGVITYAIISFGFYSLFRENIPRSLTSFSLIWSRLKWKAY